MSGDFSKESGWFYNIHIIPSIKVILEVPKELFEKLVAQVNNVERKKNNMQ
jgi:hypothetical protein